MNPAYGNNKSNKKLIVIVIVIILVIASVFFAIKNSKFHVVSTDPNTNEVASVSPFFKINFNKTLSSNGLKVSSSPAIISSYKVSGKYINADLNIPLQLNQTYTITVGYVADAAGDTITNRTFTFTAKDVPSNGLSKEQQQALLHTQTQYLQNTSDPILGHLPYGGLTFSLSGTQTMQNGKTVVILNARLLLTAADVNSGPDAEQAAINQYKQDVINYIQSLGINPNNYTINYEVVQPTT
jgi:hypothetical protein